MSFEQDRNEAHRGHPIETISVAPYARPQTPNVVEIECTRCAEILFHVDNESAAADDRAAIDFVMVLGHVGHGVEVVEEGAALVCRADGAVLHVAEQ